MWPLKGDLPGGRGAAHAPRPAPAARSATCWPAKLRRRRGQPRRGPGPRGGRPLRPRQPDAAGRRRRGRGASSPPAARSRAALATYEPRAEQTQMLAVVGGTLAEGGQLSSRRGPARQEAGLPRCRPRARGEEQRAHGDLDEDDQVAGEAAGQGHRRSCGAFRRRARAATLPRAGQGRAELSLLAPLVGRCSVLQRPAEERDADAGQDALLADNRNGRPAPNCGC